MLITGALTLLVAYGFVLVALFLLQRQLMYHPERGLQGLSAYRLAGFDERMLTSADGVRIVAWHHPARIGYPTLLYFHGNAGHIGDRSDKLQALAAHGFGVLAISYRGYGRSDGAPSEDGLYEDARAAYRHARESLGLSPAQIVLYGESLGSGVAVQMATEQPAAGLVLESPYTSVVARAQALYPYVPVRWLLHDRYDSLGKIARVHIPLLLFHGALDTVIPISDGRALLAAANEPKRGMFYDDIGHVAFLHTALTGEIERFGREQGWIRDDG